MRDSQSEAKRWFLQGMQDLDDAKFNLSGNRYNVACFLAQQSAEKFLKAYLLAQGAEKVWGHSTRNLSREAETFDDDFKTIEYETRSLEKYYIPTRYPDALPGVIPSEAFDNEDANKAISLASKIMDFIKKLMIFED